LRNLPLKRLAADALGEIELMGCVAADKAANLAG
jgi:hypothetical protein